MLSKKFKNLKKVAALGAIAAACGFAKAEENYEDIQALPNGQVLVHNTNGQIQGVKTPFMFVDGDLNRGFAPVACSNATSVASNGTNCYANVDGKVVAFKLTKDGIPESKIERCNMVSNPYGEPTTVDGKIIGATTNGFVATFKDNGLNVVGKFTREETTGTTNYVATKTGFFFGTPHLSYDDGENVFTLDDVGYCAIVDKNTGNVLQGTRNLETNFSDPITAISLSADKKSIYATTGKTNEYAVINAETGNFISNATISVSGDVKKVIDNPKNLGKMIYITRDKMGLTK